MWLYGIEAYRHKAWHETKREPDFTTVTSLLDMEKSNYGTNGIRFTGRTHEIDNTIFYEIDLIRKDFSLTEDLGNPFLELVDEILREAENLLRANYKLPRIGEGWASEVQLYNLVKKTYKDALLHATPDWLKPQHLDIFVHSKNMAFEYQGRQHYEPVEFFGGEDAFIRLQKQDIRKNERCKSNRVMIIYWNYDEPINSEILNKKLSIL